MHENQNTKTKPNATNNQKMCRLHHWTKKSKRSGFIATCNNCKKKYKYWGSYHNHKKRCIRNRQTHNNLVQLASAEPDPSSGYIPQGQYIKLNKMTTTYYEDGVPVAWECRRKCDSTTKRWYNKNEYYNHFRKYHVLIKQCPVHNCPATFKRYDSLHKHMRKIHQSTANSVKCSDSDLKNRL